MDTKQWQSGRYDPQSAAALAKCAAWAYTPVEWAYARYAEHDFDLVRYTSHNLSVDVAHKEGTTIVAFAGTDDLADWRVNFSVHKTDWNGYQVHAGFQHGEQNLFRQMAGDFTADVTRVWITGHSLGGAMATMHALRWVDGPQPEVLQGLYTYGAPRCMDRRSASMMDAMSYGRHFRHVNGNDIVPRVPSCFRFRHCGQHVRINRFGEVIHSPSPFYTLYDRVLGYRADLIQNHFMEKYIEPLKKQVTK